MKIAMSGSTGFVGSYLRTGFAEKGWLVVPLTRDDFANGVAAVHDKIEGCDAVINLAGAPIAARWTHAYKKVLYESRVPLTQKIAAAMHGLERRPAVFISASGVGIYPNGGPWTEEDGAFSDDFLGHLAWDWEQAALEAQSAGVRTAVFRFGVVLGRGGGALAKMLPLFRLGLGGVIGRGTQPVSWVHITDLAAALCAALEQTSFSGIYNLSAPQPTTNAGLTRALAAALHRPAFLPVPAFAMKLAFGEGACVLLGGQAAIPKRLQEAGFQFAFERIEDALVDLLK
ncbi:MAG: TIGR01777 family protein [Deltaproteobacteria bacterium]|nr:TIGR01777 family protein [Deltaproteobacteria bacterium]